MERKIRDPKRAKLLARRRRVTRRMAQSGRARLTVFRSTRHIYAQLVDAASGRTVGAVSTRSKAVSEGLASTSSVEAARRVGKAIAELARARDIDEVVFNRNGFLYHGRVKALAEAAREAGLRF
jgi:large subunit ribosomal protein L18